MRVKGQIPSITIKENKKKSICESQDLQLICSVLVMLCMCTIFTLSSMDKDASVGQSFAVSQQLLDVVSASNFQDFATQLKAIAFYQLDWYIRKIAHMGEYTVLALLLCGSLRFGTEKHPHGILLAFVIGVLYGCSDEIHQWFVPGRGCNLIDVMFDSIGAGVGCLLFQLFWVICAGKQKKNASKIVSKVCK